MSDKGTFIERLRRIFESSLDCVCRSKCTFVGVGLMQVLKDWWDWHVNSMRFWLTVHAQVGVCFVGILISEVAHLEKKRCSSF